MGAVPQFENESLGRHQTYPIYLFLDITGAKAASIVGDIFQATFGFDTPGSATAALGQTTIDNLLGSTSEVIAATAFGSTAMGTDAFGFVLYCNGQIKSIQSIEVLSNIGSGGATVSAVAPGITTALPNTLPALARVAVTSAGNIAGQFVLAGLDAATDGLIQIQINAYLK